MKLSKLEVFDHYEDHEAVVFENIRRQDGACDKLRILEAGCGREWPYRVDNLPIHLTGVDLDGVALEARRRSGDLDSVVHGDLREVHFLTGSFDVIYSKFVLEHVKDAEIVVGRFLDWLRPGGLLVLIFPDRESVYSVVTRMTPLWFHVFFKKYIIGEKEAGQVGFGPYPTYSEKITGRTYFHKYCMTKGIEIVAEYGLNDARMPRLLVWFMKSVELLSLGRVKGNHINLVYILRAPGD